MFCFEFLNPFSGSCHYLLKLCLYSYDFVCFVPTQAALI